VLGKDLDAFGWLVPVIILLVGKRFLLLERTRYWLFLIASHMTCWRASTSMPWSVIS